MTVAQNVGFGLQMRRVSKGDAAECIANALGLVSDDFKVALDFVEVGID